MNVTSSLRKVDGTQDLGHGGPSGITLKEGAPMRTEAGSDATWGKFTPTTKKAADVYGYITSAAGAATCTRTKALSVMSSSSMGSEGVGTMRVTEVMEHVCDINAALGVDPGPPLVTSDNIANVRVASGEASATNARHELRRYVTIVQRVVRGKAALRHVDGDQCPADFLTKFLDLAKFEASIEYATNASAAVEETDPALVEAQRAKLAAAIEAVRADASQLESDVAAARARFAARVAKLGLAAA